jgi:hypothetical protein
VDRLKIREKILQWCPTSLLDEYDQSLSQEAVRDALEEAAKVADKHAKECGEKGLMPICFAHAATAIAIRALKREPNAAAPFSFGEQIREGKKPAELAEPAPAAPDVAKAIEEIRYFSRAIGERVPSQQQLEQWAALLAKLGQGWIPSARFSWGPGGMVADPKGGYVWVDIPKLCADCLQPEYCGRNGCIQPAPGASDE